MHDALRQTPVSRRLFGPEDETDVRSFEMEVGSRDIYLWDNGEEKNDGII